MKYEAEYEVNQAAYERLKDHIAAAYPKGRFVALAGGAIVADAESFAAVAGKLDALGWEPLKTMVILAGDDTPEYVEILSFWTDADE